MERNESEYSEDFEEEEVNSIAIHSSKPSGGNMSVSRKGRERSGARLTVDREDRRWDNIRHIEEQYITPNRPPHTNTTTTSKSTGKLTYVHRTVSRTFIPRHIVRRALLSMVQRYSVSVERLYRETAYMLHDTSLALRSWYGCTNVRFREIVYLSRNTSVLVHSPQTLLLLH